MKKLMFFVVLYIAGCSNIGKPCTDWRVQPGKEALVQAYVDSVLSTILVTQRTENEDWDDFEHAAFNDAVLLYGYHAEGVRVDGPHEYNECFCKQDQIVNEIGVAAETRIGVKARVDREMGK